MHLHMGAAREVSSILRKICRWRSTTSEAHLRLHASLQERACGRCSRSTPQASLLFSQGTAWQMLEIASQLPRTWCLLSPACYLMYEGARGHGGIQTPIYPPSRIARVSGRPVVPLLKRGGVGEEDDRAAFCSLASAIRRHRASLCSLPTCMYCADAVGGTLWTSAAGGLGLCVTACQMSSPGRWY